jgi:hypothetical protein
MLAEARLISSVLGAVLLRILARTFISIDPPRVASKFLTVGSSTNIDNLRLSAVSKIV